MIKQLPLIDPRDEQDLLRIILQKSMTYTPEWNFEPDVMDGGGAIATLFAQMFGETIARLNCMPYKCFLEFLNILDISVKSITPAAGVAQFELASGAVERVAIPQNTSLFSDLQNGGDSSENSRVLFETQFGFHATPAKLIGLFNVNPQLDRIERAEFNERFVRFFSPLEQSNIQKHMFAVASDDVFALKSPSEIVIKLGNRALKYRDDEIAGWLTDANSATWSYYNGHVMQPFSNLFVKNGLVHLIKDNDERMSAFVLNDDHTDEHIWVFCEIRQSAYPTDIVMDSICVGSSYLYKNRKGIHIKPDAVYANDIPINAEGGYCFGRSLRMYDSLYISSDEVFSKHGARVNMNFQLGTVTRNIGAEAESPIADFLQGKYIVEKMPSKINPRDPVFISRIIWEYWNGTGWKNLDTEGEQNLFDGKERHEECGISFICPEDMQKSIQNAVESYWIRARVIEIDNQFSLYGCMLLPFLESLSLDFNYKGDLKPVKYVHTENNCSVSDYQWGSQSSPVFLYRPLSDTAGTVYLAFDKQPDGFPICLYFKMEGRSKQKSAFRFEYFSQNSGWEGKWKELKVHDRTEGLSEDGVISIFSPSDYQESVFFAQKGYFIRIVDLGISEKQGENCPVVKNVSLNTMYILQQQTVENELFRTELFERKKIILLRNRPVLECECWINEFSDIAKTERDWLLEKHPRQVKVVKNSVGQISEFWVKWERKEDFSASSADSRHYVLDNYNGRILFGDSIRGRIPSAAPQPNICVNYCYGGGEKGNLPAGAITGLVNSIPFVENVTNPEMICGGSTRHDIETLERTGPQKLRHRGRAVTSSDFETLIYGQFSEVKNVRCIYNYNHRLQHADGFVTVVIMPYDIQNKRYTLQLCRKIQQYLSGIISCELVAGERFSVISATVLYIDVTATIVLDNEEFAMQAEKKALEAISDLLSPDSAHYPFHIGEIPSVADIFNCLQYVYHISWVNDILLVGRYYDGNTLKTVPIDSKFDKRDAVAVNGQHTIRI